MRETYKFQLLTILIISILMLEYYFNPFDLEGRAHKVILAGILMISLWIQEWIPMPVVALLPLVIFPVLNIETLQDISKVYADPIIFLFMGGFFLALAIEKWNLHQRIALNILKFSGTNGNQILFGFMISTFLISMWISNTATTMMMFPMAVSVLNVLGHQIKEKQLKNFSVPLLLSIAYASNIGGLSTIIGTPPNTAFVGYLSDELNRPISFTKWFVICFPLALLILALLYFVLTKLLFRNEIKANQETEFFINQKIMELGKWKLPEKRVLIIFLFTALMWLLKDLIVSISGIPLNDTIIALLAALALFCVPSGRSFVSELPLISEENSGKPFHNNLLVWQDTKSMAWGILLMFGGGLALAKAMENAGVMKMIGNGIANYAPNNTFLLVIMIATISIFLSEIMSNIAQVIVMAPILCSLALAMGIEPILLGLPMTLAASCAGMLPMGTPPNAIVFASGKIPLKKMLRVGFVLNIISILVISIFCYFFLF